MVNTRNLSIIPSLNCREWKYKDANFCISSFPISSSNISPYHSPSCYSSSFLNASISLISIHLMFNYLALSFFHTLSSPSSDPIPISFSPNILLQCAVQVWVEKEPKCLSLLSILTPDNTELQDCMTSSFAFSCPKARWILWKQRWANFS